MSRPRAQNKNARRENAAPCALPDDLFIQIESWPRIGRPVKHDVETSRVTDDWPAQVPVYDAIESGVADLDDPALKERIAGLKATRDQAQVDAARAVVTLESSGQAITPAMLSKFARIARERMRIDGGGYRRDHLRDLAQRVEVADGEVRIMGSKGDLLRTLAAASGVKSAAGGVPSSVLNWRSGWDSNPRYAFDVYTLSRRAPSTARPPLRASGAFYSGLRTAVQSRSAGGMSSAAINAAALSARYASNS